MKMLDSDYESFVKKLLDEPIIECDFSIGDRVTFTNDYGVSFEGLTIIGFSSEELYGKFIHLNSDAWWFPVSPSSLKLEKKKTK